MVYYNNRREPVEKEETDVWSCTSDHCQGFMRPSYSFHDKPTCPLCGSSMKEDKKLLPKLTH